MAIKPNIRILLVLLFVFVNAVSFGQGFHTEFGKSKVQYEKFEWYFYRTNAFEVYYHQGGKNLAQYVLAHSDRFLDEVETSLDYRIGERITIIIYNTYSDYEQSNITLKDEQYNIGGLTPIVDNIGFVYFDGDHKEFDKRIKSAITEVIINEAIYGNSIQQRIQNATLITLPDWYYNSFVKYISGNWDIADETKLQEGLIHEKYKKFGKLNNYDKILIGYSLWDYIDKVYGSSALSNILYMVRINKNIESGFTYILGKTFRDIYLEWYKATRYKYLSKEEDKFQALHHLENINKFGKKSEITRVELDPQGDKIAYVTNKRGKAKVFVQTLGSKKKKKVYKRGQKKVDYHQDLNYPVIDWHPKEDKLIIAYEKKSEPYVYVYDLEKNKKEQKARIERIDKILDLDFDDNGSSIVMSGIKNGSSDIFVYQLRSRRLFQVTNDIYDDLEPKYVNQSKGIVFSSNRKDVELKRKYHDPEKQFSAANDIFYYDAKTKSKTLKQVTFTPEINETSPDAYDTFFISYLTDENTIINRNAAYIDSVFKHIRVVVSYVDTSLYDNDTFYFYQNDTSLVNFKTKTYYDTLVSLPDTSGLNLPDSIAILPDTSYAKQLAEILRIDTAIIYRDTAYSFKLTNYPTNIQSYDISARAHTIMELFRYGDAYQLAVFPTPVHIKKSAIERTLYEDIFKELQAKKNENLIEELDKDEETSSRIKTQVTEPKTNTEALDSFEYYFYNDFDVMKIDTSSNKEQAKELVFSEEDGYEPPSGKKQKKKYTKTKFGSSSMYFMSFTPDYLVSQIDNSYLQTPYLPYSQGDAIEPFNQGVNAFVMLGTSDHFNDFKINGGFRLKSNLSGAEYLMTFENLRSRLDKKFVFYRSGESSGDVGTRNRQLINEGRIQLKYPFTEFASVRADVFVRQDRTTMLSTEQTSLETPDDITTFAGSKYEFVFDNTIEYATNILSGTRFKVYFENFRNINTFKSEFSVYGLDLRNYIKIHREFIWANRLAFASSIGGSKVAFFLGGVDNWLFPKVNEEIQADPDVNYVYKSLAVNMRGFEQNIRNGNSYAVINSELRLPVVKYFSNRPLKSAFWENFQIIGFADVGTAWNGFHPYSEDNSLNKRVIDSNPFYITVETMGEPIVAGYGFGLRAELFGYFVRLDHAWGLEGFERFGETTYISLGLDF